MACGRSASLSGQVSQSRTTVKLLRLAPACRWARRAAVAATLLAALVLASAALAGASNDVAVVVASPITQRTFDHWIFVAAKTTAANAPGAPVIAPTDPPGFAGCIRQVRQRIPSLKRISRQTIRFDCARLFRSMTNQVLDFLIREKWYELRAAEDGIAITAAQVQQHFEADKRHRFKTNRQFARFLRRTGQTIADVLFRERATLTFRALLKVEQIKEAALDAEVRRLFQSRTTCARYYVTDDCGSS
jgi:foldase protein PrsA